MLREIKSQEALIKKKWSDGKLSLLFWVWEATPMQGALDKGMLRLFRLRQHIYASVL